jgi:hypothetical protein
MATLDEQGFLTIRGRIKVQWGDNVLFGAWANKTKFYKEIVIRGNFEKLGKRNFWKVILFYFS